MFIFEVLLMKTTQKQNTMTTTENNIENALMTAKLSLTQMLKNGFGSEPKHIFALSNMLCENYNLTQDQSIIIIDEALKIA